MAEKTVVIDQAIDFISAILTDFMFFLQDSQTEIRAELIKLMNDWIAKLITDQEYKNAVGEILGFIN